MLWYTYSVEVYQVNQAMSSILLERLNFEQTTYFEEIFRLYLKNSRSVTHSRSNPNLTKRNFLELLEQLSIGLIIRK